MDERSEMTPPFSKAEPREIFKLVTFIDYMHKRIDFNQPISPCYTLITQKSKIQQEAQQKTGTLSKTPLRR